MFLMVDCTYLLHDNSGSGLFANGSCFEGIGGYIDGSTSTSTILRLDVEVLLLVARLVLERTSSGRVRGTYGRLTARTGHHVMQAQHRTRPRAGSRARAVLWRNLLELAGDVVELVQLGVGVVAG